jgi:hypothetical protein
MENPMITFKKTGTNNQMVYLNGDYVGFLTKRWRAPTGFEKRFYVFDINVKINGVWTELPPQATKTKAKSLIAARLQDA